MGFQFITKQDLELYIQGKLLTANSEGNPLLESPILIGIEGIVLDYISSRLSSKYDMDTAFNAAPEDRNGVVLSIVLRMVLYKFIRRNAARKVPEDYRKDYEEAMLELKMIQKGEIIPGLPPLLDDEGAAQPLPIHGNSTNTDNYL